MRKSPVLGRLAEQLVATAQAKVASSDPIELWRVLHREFLNPSIPFETHLECYRKVYEKADFRPSWLPSDVDVETANIHRMMKTLKIANYDDFYRWSIEQRGEYWQAATRAIDIKWRRSPSQVFSDNCTEYFPNGVLNITESLFHKRDADDPAIVYASEDSPTDIQNLSFSHLKREGGRIANAFVKEGLVPGDAVAICLPMIPEAVSTYIAIIMAGGVVVSIADSFSAEEIAVRCRITRPKFIVTQDILKRGDRTLPLYPRIVEALNLVRMTSVNASNHQQQSVAMESRVVVIPCTDSAVHPSVNVRSSDCDWETFLEQGPSEFVAVSRSSMDPCNVLFSSGTTGEPKAIVWNHTTPIKCAVDGYLHQNIQIGDRITWPTNMGWMMGPWLVFQLINGATIGLMTGLPSTKSFCQFVEAADIDMVGVIPSLVKAWRAANATDGCDWKCVKRFSSTGEASDPTDYLWLASRVPGYAPIIEYCGGTEIGGSFLSSTVIQPNVPSMFSTPVLGAEFVILSSETESSFLSQDQSGSGELALVPPSVGWSTKLLNRCHDETYFADMCAGPSGQKLRRHGDEVEQVIFDNGARYYRALGRCDDTMNLGGIKVASVEIERVCNLVQGVLETAAIAISNGGPSKLVIYVVLDPIFSPQDTVDMVQLQKKFQDCIKLHLNPLFTIHDVIARDSLPRTASNKVMRRLLRDEYVKAIAKE